jgi:hypothetical protein
VFEEFVDEKKRKDSKYYPARSMYWSVLQVWEARLIIWPMVVIFLAHLFICPKGHLCEGHDVRRNN